MFQSLSIELVNGFEIRVAENHEGRQIRDLVKEHEYPVDVWGNLSWEDIKPDWIVAVRGDVVLGAIQAVGGKPVGHVEFLVSRRDLSHRDRSMVVKSLVVGGMAMCKTLGSQCCKAFVPNDPELRSYKRVLKRMGITIFGTGNMIMRKV